jgi:hypothetical protein
MAYVYNSKGLNHNTLKRCVPIFIVVFTLLGTPQLLAQYKSERDATIPLEHFYIERHKSGIFRLLLSKLHVGISTGYGRTFFRHDLEGFGIIQQPDSVPMIFNSANSTARYSNWFNGVGAAGAATAPGSFLVNFDTTELGFRSKAISIPLKGTLHIEFDRYRIGGGYSYEFMHIGNFKPLSYDNAIGSFAPQANNFFLKKYFGMIGASVYRYYEYVLVVDANIGGYKLGNQFDQSLIKKGVYYNLGVTVEREFSEYFKVFVRPSYELKKYKLSIPETGQTLTHRFNAFYLNIGATYRLPEIRRCFLKDCHAQINHAHGNKEYRSRRHPIWKKQNPHYGENYPTLIKYKGKNKKKLNPY